MLRPSFARKVVRLRAARLWGLTRSAEVSTYHTTSTPPPPRTSPYIPQDVAQTSGRHFPLYQPPPPRPPSLPLNEETLASLPSEQQLSRQLKTRLTKKAIEDLPPFEEDDLRNFYKDLVRTGLKDPNVGRLALEGPGGDARKRISFSKEEREDILRRVEGRLVGSVAGSGSGQSQLLLEGGGVANGGGELSIASIREATKNSPTHHRVFALLASVAVGQGTGPSETSKGKANAGVGGMDIPLGVVSRKEWDALFEEFIERGDARGAESLLDVMNLHGAPLQEERIADIMKVDAMAGRTDEVARLSMELIQSGLPVLPSHQDLVMMALLRQNPSNPQIAISHLTQAEEAGRPLPQSSYHVVLSHLTQPSPLTQPNAHTRALAWDLFTHMRLAAHSTPSRELYTTMIRVCGDARQPQPERARDLWIEMTESEKMDPTRDEYAAIIRSLGSTKKDYLEAFDLLRQMLAKHHDATFVPFAEEDGHQMPTTSEYLPTLETFTALLEGTKRAGDLNRARWVLTEVVKLAKSGQIWGAEDWKKGADEELLAGVFMTYAAWKPVVGRELLKVKQDVGEKAVAEEIQGATAEAEQGGEEWLDVDVLEELVEPVNSQAIENTETVTGDIPITPQSSADAIREATALFQRILHDQQAAAQGATNEFLPFKDVRLTPRLINSYLSVHLAHSSSLAGARKEYDSAWDAVSKLSKTNKPNGWTYLQILEKCASGTRGGIEYSDRSVAYEWGCQLWSEYVAWSETVSKEIESISDLSAQQRRRWLSGLGDRQTERVWRSVIRLHALLGSSSTSLSLLELFHQNYPPLGILQTYAPLPEVGLKIKMSTPGSTPEAQVPPYLLFDDVRVLHQRLVKVEDGEGIGRLKWIVSRYKAALGKRLKWRMKGVGQGRERRKAKDDLEKLAAGVNMRRRIEEEHDEYGPEEYAEGDWESEQPELEQEKWVGRG
ncbi:hypothetical protein CI109_105132 [Kwoniella shandongensis]|uniref:Uncharacterized protein n=1 Tax=Kwoniella shandongensis TaxID=1734106 RepID=A0A5M6C350_9TREE|nr:uncharacterized protein CI109_001971 [Kwoniella shandongensis]KAA5529546.1 hypothetical protein CI109_001971 [Kwoniella shandongensis]